MPRLTKSQMILEMAELGELPPREWTMVEIAARLEELRAEAGLPMINQRKEKTQLRKMVIALNEAAKKKSTLIAFAQNQLRIHVSMNDTIQVIQKNSLTKIYAMAETNAEDPVGFGKHASLTYQEVLELHPDYCKWAVTTAKESEEGKTCDPRLYRLATWLQQQEQQPHTGPVQSKRPPIPRAVLIQKGYIKSEKMETKKETMEMTEPSMTSSASESATSSQLRQTQDMIKNLVTMMGDLKEEVQEMKAERPRKEVKKEDDMSSLGSFDAVSK